MCGWVLQSENAFVWREGHNMSDSTDEDFIQDHTLGNAAGYFLYIAEQASESSGPAVMATEPLHNSFIECTMEFWYALFIRFYFIFPNRFRDYRFAQYT